MAKILVVEDEPDIALGLQEDLEQQGYDVTTVADGESALRCAATGAWDLILLDIMLPKVDGFEVCRRLRRERVKAHIIMLTAKVQEAEKVLGLELGADDYVTKPYSPRELRARINAALRRCADESQGTCRFGDVEVDFDRAEIRRGAVAAELTAIELRLMKVFARRRGHVLTRAQLIDAAWERGTFVTDRAVDTHVWNLRRKIESNPAEPCHIVGVRGIGYRFQ